MTPTLASTLALALLALTPAAAVAPAVAATASPDGWPPYLHRGARLSAAYERMLRDRMARGVALPDTVVRRHALEPAAADPAERDASRVEPGPALPPSGTALAPDVRMNDRAWDSTCGACSYRPLGQAETTIAAHEDRAVAGWNDTQGFCLDTAVQGYAWTTDGGLTWTDAGDPPALPTGGRFRGDPVHAVNPRTGDFYILGLYEGGTPGSGLALARGHFGAGGFVIDDSRQIAVGGSDFLDKEWMAADSLSGNLYVAYANFLGGVTSRIEFIRSTDNGATWSAPLAMNAPAADGRVQGVRPAVGPDGEVYVVWYEEDFPKSHLRLRRSDDFGGTFGPEATVCDFYENSLSGAPGFRRPFGLALPGIAVDAGHGPHRGRVYVTWNESVNFYDAPFDLSTPRVEVENDGFFASATPFVVGERLGGTMQPGGTDVDLFRFTGERGRTVFVVTDSVPAGNQLALRLVCPADTTSLGTYRLLAYSQSRYPAFAFTLPADGDYFLRVTLGSGPLAFGYRIATTWDTPTADDRARDHRDAFIAWSDDGASWSAPVRLNDDDPWFDGIFPEVAVDGTGVVHVFWHDFRDDGCGALSFEYVVSSGDGGTTWGPNRRLSDEASFWSWEACGSANQGDYQGITASGEDVWPCWSDSRLGDPDAWAERDRLDPRPVCPLDRAIPPAATATQEFRIENRGTVTAEFSWNLSDDLGWIGGTSPAPSGTVLLGPGDFLPVVAGLLLPADCEGAADTLRFTVTDPAIPGRTRTCASAVRCDASTAADAAAAAALALAPPRPNPASGRVAITYSLPRAGPARLAVFDASGSLVRTLAEGTSAAGRHETAWDGSRADGHPAAPGVYFLRLEAGAARLQRPVSLLR